jgi:hypothetical protein
LPSFWRFLGAYRTVLYISFNLAVAFILTLFAVVASSHNFVKSAFHTSLKIHSIFDISGFSQILETISFLRTGSLMLAIVSDANFSESARLRLANILK